MVNYLQQLVCFPIQPRPLLMPFAAVLLLLSALIVMMIMKSGKMAKVVMTMMLSSKRFLLNLNSKMKPIRMNWMMMMIVMVMERFWP